MKKLLTLFMVTVMANAPNTEAIGRTVIPLNDHTASAITKANRLQSTEEVTITPNRDVTIDDETGAVTVAYTFSAIEMDNDDLFEDCTQWNLSRFGKNITPGEGAWLHRLDRISVPKGHNAILEILDSEYKEFDYELAPARQLLSESSNETYTLNNIIPIAQYDGYSPASVVEISETSLYRGQPICKVVVSPMQYNHKEKKIRIYTSIVYRVSFEYEEAPMSDSTYHASMLGYMEDTDSNISDTYIDYSIESDVTYEPFGGIENQPQSISVPGTLNPPVTISTFKIQDYLILTKLNYYPAAVKFANWKRMLGFNPVIVTRNTWSTSDILNIIKSKYASLDNLQYVLLLGDFGDLPGIEDKDPNNITFYTDFQYGCIEGDDDDESDLFVGRVSASSLSEANVIVSKIIEYEKNPPTSSSFYNHSSHCAFFQDNSPKDGYEDRRFVKTSEELTTYMMSLGKSVDRFYGKADDVTPLYWNNGIYSYGEPIPTMLKKPWFAWKADIISINNAFNAGRFYVLYRGHGGYDCWDSINYSSSDITNTPNGYPVIMSITCTTGQYKNDCFAERLLKRSGGGAVGVFAASSTSYSGPNDVLAEGLFDAIYPEPGIYPTFPNTKGTPQALAKPIYTLGGILQHAANMTQEIYANTAYAKVTRRLFHIFGDPSMELRTEYLGTVPFSTKPAPTQLKEGFVMDLTNSPDDIRIVAYDSITGKVSYNATKRFELFSDHPEKISICISAHNYKPVITTADKYSFPPSGPVITSQTPDSTFLGAFRNEGTSKEIDYKIPAYSNSAELIILNKEGNKVDLIQLSTSDKEGTISLSSELKGIHTIILTSNGQEIGSRKVIL